MYIRLTRKLSYIPLSLLLTFCNSNEIHQKIFTFKVTRTDFYNKIITNGVIEAKRAVTITCPDIWPQPKINYLIPEGSYVKKDEIVCRLDAAEVENNYKIALNELETLRSEVKKTEAAMELNRNILETQLQAVDATVKIAKLQAAKLAYVSPTRKKLIELQIEKSEVEKSKAIKKLASSKIIQQSETNRLRMKIKQAENNLARAKTFLERLILKAPTDGVVIYETNWMTQNKVQEGDAIWHGMPIVNIPGISHLQVKLQLQESYVKRIQKGQKVKIYVDAYPEIDLTGAVTFVTSMGKPVEEGSKIKTFEAFVSIDSTNYKLQPGLTTTCHIYASSFRDTLVIPKECVFEKDSMVIVYKKEKSKYEMKQVSLGESNDDFVVVVDGLNVGDELSLSEPPNVLIHE